MGVVYLGIQIWLTGTSREKEMHVLLATHYNDDYRKQH